MRVLLWWLPLVSVLAWAKVTPDPRCLYASSLNLDDDAAVTQSNRLCDIEHRVLEFTNKRRAQVGRAPLEYHRGLSYVARYQASLPYVWNHQRALNHFYENWMATWFPESSHLFVAGENAYPPKYFGATPEEIAYGLADHPTKGWNHHPGHAENVIDSEFTYVGIGVGINADGRVTGFCAFARRSKYR